MDKLKQRAKQCRSKRHKGSRILMLEEFHKDASRSDGYSDRCKKCEAGRMKSQAMNHKDPTQKAKAKKFVSIFDENMRGTQTALTEDQRRHMKLMADWATRPIVNV